MADLSWPEGLAAVDGSNGGNAPSKESCGLDSWSPMLVPKGKTRGERVSEALVVGARSTILASGPSDSRDRDSTRWKSRRPACCVSGGRLGPWSPLLVPRDGIRDEIVSEALVVGAWSTFLASGPSLNHRRLLL